jgi:hypothetical protein
MNILQPAKQKSTIRGTAVDARFHLLAAVEDLFDDCAALQRLEAWIS